jgi:DNA mismatch repair ATPase MutL
LDDGCGIRSVDLGLAATRFATSKLKQLTDFDSLTTFGF